MLGRADVVGGDEVARQAACFVLRVRHGTGVDKLPVGQQLEGVDIHALLALLARLDDVAAVVMGEARLYAVAGVVGQRQRYGAGRRYAAVVGETTTGFGQRGHQGGIHLGHLLHVAAVARMQHLALHLVAELDAIARHLGAQPQHLAGHFELLLHDGGRTLLLRQRQGFAPAGHGQLLGDLLGKGH